MQLLSYEPLSPAASISVPATPHNTPDELADRPVYATLTVPDPNHYMVYDVQVRTLPIEYMCTFGPNTRPIISNNNESILVFTIVAPTPVAHLSPPNFELTLEHAEGTAQNMGQMRGCLVHLWTGLITLPTQQHQHQPDRTAPSLIPKMKMLKTILRKSRCVNTSEIFFPRFFSQLQKI